MIWTGRGGRAVVMWTGKGRQAGAGSEEEEEGEGGQRGETYLGIVSDTIRDERVYSELAVFG